MPKSKTNRATNEAVPPPVSASGWLRITTELQVAANSVRNSWSNVLWKNISVYQLDAVELKIETEDQAKAILPHVKTFGDMLAQRTTDDRNRQREWLEKNPSALSKETKASNGNQQPEPIKAPTQYGALVTVTTSTMFIRDFDDLVQDVCATAKAGNSVPTASIALAQAYLAAFDAQGVISSGLVNPSTDYLWEIEEAQRAFERWFVALVRFLRLACGSIQEVPNHVVITQDLAVLIDGKACGLSTVQKRGLFTLALLDSDSFTPDQFMKWYENKSSGATGQEFYNVGAEIQKIAPHFDWESSGKRWIKGLLLEVHASNSSMEKYLAGFYK